MELGQQLIIELMARSMEDGMRLARAISRDFRDPGFQREYSPPVVVIGCLIAAAYLSRLSLEKSLEPVTGMIPKEALADIASSSFASMVDLVGDYISKGEKGVPGVPE